MSTYIPTERVKVKALPWQEMGLSYTASGYGKKIPTRYMVHLGGRWRRVYVTQYSNAGSAWVVESGKRVHVDFDTQEVS